MLIDLYRDFDKLKFGKEEIESVLEKRKVA